MSVELHYLGHFGNNLFQYAFGRLVAEQLGYALHCHPAEDIPGWAGIERAGGVVDRLTLHLAEFEDLPQQLPGEEAPGPALRWVKGDRVDWHGQGVNLPYLLNPAHKRRIVLKGYFQRSEYYHPHKQKIAQWFRMKPKALKVQFQPDDVVVHLRRSIEMRVLERALDLDYYLTQLRAMRPGQVYLCGTGIDSATREAFAEFSPREISENGIDTFRILRTAPRIIMANSTFSWWAAYLSDAREVVYPRPVFGHMSLDRPEVMLEVPEDRYRYIDDVELEKWAPLRRNTEVRASVQEAQGRLRLSIEARGKPPVAISLAPPQRQWAEWLARQQGRFGEQDCIDAGQGSLLYFPRTLAQCIGAGLFEAQPDFMRYLEIRTTGAGGSPG